MKLLLRFGLGHLRDDRDVTVDSAAQASATMRRVIEEACYGASDMAPDCGDVIDDSGHRVFRVSYNGRVWAMNGSEVMIMQTVWLVGIFFNGGSVAVGASDYGRGKGFKAKRNQGTLPRRTAEAFANRGLVEIVDGVAAVTQGGLDFIASINGTWA